MVSDGLSLMNAEYSSTSFRLVPVSVGSRNFLGNNIAYPPQARSGDNVLLGTKVMVPLDGEVRENVGLLGSPCFEIPRSVDRDSAFDRFTTPDEKHRRLILKNWHNLRTALLFLAVRWFDLLVVTAMAWAAADAFGRYGAWALATWSIVGLLYSTLYFVAVERCATRFRALRPKFCSIYEQLFWRHERFWKLGVPTGVEVLFNGTPLKNCLWRMLGVHMLGGRVFDDGCAIPERSLVSLGADCTLNAGSTIQCHSLEDAAFKLDGIMLGAGCTLGTNAFVHYGVTIGEGAVLAADSFLMKGSEIGPHCLWAGNPAAEQRTAVGPLHASPSPSLPAAGGSGQLSASTTTSGEPSSPRTEE